MARHRVFYRDDHPSRYQPRPTGLIFGEQTGTGVFPLVIAVPLLVIAVPLFKLFYHSSSIQNMKHVLRPNSKLAKIIVLNDIANRCKPMIKKLRPPKH